MRPEERRIEIFRTSDGSAEVVEIVEGNVRRAILPFATVVDTSRWWLDVPPETTVG